MINEKVHDFCDIFSFIIWWEVAWSLSWKLVYIDKSRKEQALKGSVNQFFSWLFTDEMKSFMSPLTFLLLRSVEVRLFQSDRIPQSFIRVVCIYFWFLLNFLQNSEKVFRKLFKKKIYWIYLLLGNLVWSA